MDKTSKILAILSIALLGSLVLDQSTAEGTTTNLIVDAIRVLALGQGELINQNSVNLYQNDILIEQNQQIIELLKGNKNIYVPEVTDRYIYLEFLQKSQCIVYDRQQQLVYEEYCPASTPNQFKTLITGNPEN